MEILGLKNTVIKIQYKIDEESKLFGSGSVENICIKAKENKEWKNKRIIRNIWDTVKISNMYN